jgi:hypothetical protein
MDGIKRFKIAFSESKNELILNKKTERLERFSDRFRKLIEGLDLLGDIRITDEYITIVANSDKMTPEQYEFIKTLGFKIKYFDANGSRSYQWIEIIIEPIGCSKCRGTGVMVIPHTISVEELTCDICAGKG